MLVPGRERYVLELALIDYGVSRLWDVAYELLSSRPTMRQETLKTTGSGRRYASGGVFFR